MFYLSSSRLETLFFVPRKISPSTICSIFSSSSACYLVQLNNCMWKAKVHSMVKAFVWSDVLKRRDITDFHKKM